MCIVEDTLGKSCTYNEPMPNFEYPQEHCGNGRGQPYITPFQCRHVKQNTENPQQEKTRKSFEEIPQQKKEQAKNPSEDHVAN